MIVDEALIKGSMLCSLPDLELTLCLQPLAQLSFLVSGEFETQVIVGKHCVSRSSVPSFSVLASSQSQGGGDCVSHF